MIPKLYVIMHKKIGHPGTNKYLLVLVYVVIMDYWDRRNNLKGIINTEKPEHITSQISTNIICSYIFYIFCGKYLRRFSVLSLKW